MMLTANTVFLSRNNKFLEENEVFLQKNTKFTFKMVKSKAELYTMHPCPVIHITLNNSGIIIDLTDAQQVKITLKEKYYRSFSRVPLASPELDGDKIIVNIVDGIDPEIKESILNKMVKCYIAGNKLYELIQITPVYKKNGNGNGGST